MIGRRVYRRADFFLLRFVPGIIFFTAFRVERAAELAAFSTVRTARDTADPFFAFLAMVTSVWTSWLSCSWSDLSVILRCLQTIHNMYINAKQYEVRDAQTG